MRRLILSCVFLLSTQCFSAGSAADDGAAAINATVTTANLVIPVPGIGRQNCLTHVSSDNTLVAKGDFTLRILDTGTTVYTLLFSTNTTAVVPFASGNPLCTSVNSSTTIKNSGTSYNINATYYIRSAF